MTVTNVNDTETFNGNGVATSFPFTVRSQQISDILATHISTTSIETKLVLNTDFSVVLNANGTSTITFPLGTSGFSTLATDEKLQVRRVLPLTQTTSLNNQGPYDAKAVEKSLDRVVQMQQQNVPDVPVDANKYMFWDTEGVQQPGVSTSVIDSLIGGGDFVVDVFVSIAAIKAVASSGLIDQQINYLTGLLAAGDNGGIFAYKWDAASTATDDGLAVLIPNDTPATGRWLLVSTTDARVTKTNTISSLKAIKKATLRDNDHRNVGGYNTLGDGGGGILHWDSSSTKTVNNVTIFDTNEGGSGRWERPFFECCAYHLGWCQRRISN